MSNESDVCFFIIAATSRLEDVALAAQHSPIAPGPTGRSTEQVHEQLVGHLNNPSAAGTAGSSAPREEAPLAPSVKAYQEMIIDGPLQEFVQKSQDAAGVVGEHVSPGLGTIPER
jgi:hypothetical protein